LLSVPVCCPLAIATQHALEVSYSLCITLREYDTLSAICYYYADSGGNKKTTIGITDDCQLTNLVNSASRMMLPIGLPPKGAKFWHTLNILLVGRQHRRALLWL
jgi:hypothetical protein